MADELRTERLLLRRARLEDLTAIHRIMSDVAVMRYWSTPPHESLDESRRWLRSMIDADPAMSDDFMITLDGEPIGKLGAWRLPEIGFLIDPAHWGGGYASEAMAAFVKRRQTLGSAHLTADVDPRNAPSIRLLKRHDFVETGRAERTWLVGGDWCDSIYFRLTL